MRQYFYLVVARYDESIYPKKVFLQQYEAERWGRKEATKFLKNTQDPNWEFNLYKQEITRAGELQEIKTLKPYPTKELVNAGLINTEAGGD